MNQTLSGLDLLLKQVAENVEQSINEKSKTLINDLTKQVEELKRYTPTIVIRNDIKTEVKGLKHNQLNDLIKMVGAGLNVMMTGMAGTGKTHSAQQVAEALNLNFYCMSVGSQTSKSDLVGYMNANGEYVETMFRRAYEHGGLFVMDEIDAGNSNVLIVMNSALSNGICAFPDKMVTMNENFRFIATANTYGNGADRTYVGRNQLDGATLDRFAIIDWEIDNDLEKSLVANLKYGECWLEVVRKTREFVKDRAMRAIISPRATQKGAIVLELTDGDWKKAFNACIKPQIPTDKIAVVRDNVEVAFETAKKLIKSEPLSVDGVKISNGIPTEPKHRGRGWNFKRGAKDTRATDSANEHQFELDV